MGRDALAQGLWEVAGHHFQQALLDPDLDPAAKPGIAIRLAESFIRSGNPAQALGILEESFASQHPETPFWKAQALVQSGRLGEALEIFTSLLANPSSPHFAQSVFTTSNIQLALALPQEALNTLGYITSPP